MSEIDWIAEKLEPFCWHRESRDYTDEMVSSYSEDSKRPVGVGWEPLYSRAALLEYGEIVREEKPVAWAIAYNGELTANVFVDEEFVKRLFANMEEKFPQDKGLREIVPLYRNAHQG